MGHSIKVYNNNKEIAHLSFGATNHVMSGFLYKVLDAADFNNGVSGNGLNKIYSFENIRTAKAALRYYSNEPFEVVRNRQKEHQAESFVNKIIGAEAVDHTFSKGAISNAIAEIDAFLDQILNSKPLTEVRINFG